MKRSSRLGALAGLLGACLLNAGFVTLLAVGTGMLRLPEDGPLRVMTVDLHPPAANRRPARPTFARTSANSPSAPSDHRSSRDEPNLRARSAAPTPEAPLGVPPASPRSAGGDDAGLQAAAAVLRRLGACAAIYSDRGGDTARCGLRRDLDTPTISGVSAERRIGFDAERRRADDLVATSRALQGQTFQPEGSSAARFGCNLSHGKWRCGAY